MKTVKRIKEKFIVPTLVVVLVAFSGCTLEEDPTDAGLIPGSLNSEEALEAAVAGVYRRFTASVQWAHRWMRSYGGDDITTHSGKNKQGFREADRMEMSSLTPGVHLGYNLPYKVIKEANNIIAIKDNIKPESPDRVKFINAMLGEVYFLRAFEYFHLVRTFGRVPLMLSADILSNTNLRRSEILDIYKQVESDFLMAESLLPEKYFGAPAAIRPNSGSARAMLAKLYMHWAGWPLKDNSKYAMAASSAKQVIDNASTYGFALVPDMATLWSIKDENRFNPEIVFGLGHKQPLSNAYSNRHAGRVGSTAHCSGVTWVRHGAK
jgi:hypothetical protein